ncbi:hypothetical protein BD560DRAFT_428808 [Blakeslea trispora]|nr:hypothetical protein BD560DRAFT_428808 [Blakeslea trispora]
MVTAICDRAVAFSENAVIRVVSAQSITLEAKDSSEKVPPTESLIDKFDTIGSLNVSAYMFDDSTRPQASTRVGVESVSPIRELNFDGTILGAAMPLGVIPIDGTVAPSGLHLGELGQQKLCCLQHSIKEAFADHLEDLYEDLVDEELIANDCNPVVSNEKKEKRQTKIKSSKRKVVEKGANPKIIRTDLLSESLNNFVELMNDDIPFPSDLFVPSGSMNI